MQNNNSNSYPVWDISRDIVIEMTPEYKITYINPSGCRTLEADREWFLDKNWIHDCVPLDQKMYIISVISDFINNPGPPLDFTHDFLTLEKKRKTISWNAAVLKNIAGQTEKIILLGQDLTGLLQQGQVRRKAELKYQTIFNQSPVGIKIYDSSGKLTEINHACLEILGIKNPDEIKGSDLFSDPALASEFKTRIKEGHTVRYERELDFEKIKNDKVYTTDKSGIIYIDIQIMPVPGLVEPVYYLVNVQDITEHIMSEQSELLSRERYLSIFNNAGDAIFVHQLNGMIVDVNQIACNRLGYTQNEFYQLPPHALYPDSEAVKIPSKIQGLFNYGSMIFETIHLSRDGQSIPVEISSRIIQYAGEKHILSIARDISERVSYEKKLMVEHQRAQEYLQVAGVMIIIIHKDQTVGMINRKGCEILGYEQSEVIGKNWFDNFIPPDCRSETRHVFFRMFEGFHEQYSYWESEILNQRGEYRLIGWHNTLLSDDQGTIYATLSSGEDITLKKQAQESIQRNATTRAILHQFMLLALERQGMREMTNKIMSMLINLPWLDLEPKGTLYLHDEASRTFEAVCFADPDDEKAKFPNILEADYFNDIQGIFCETGYLLLPLFSSGKKLIGIIELFLPADKKVDSANQSFLETISQVIVGLIQQKKAEEELQLAYKRTNEIMSAIAYVLIVINENNLVTSWNDVAEKTFGLSAEQAIGKSFPDLPLAWDWCHTLRKIPFVIYQNRFLTLKNLRYTRPDNSEGFLNITVSPVRGKKSRTSEYLMIASDITDTKILEAQLMQSQKLESIGQLAAGIAHEINTPIQYVGDNLRFLQDIYTEFSANTRCFSDLLENLKKQNTCPEQAKKLQDILDNLDIDYLKTEIPTAINQSLEGISRVSSIVKAMKGFAHPDSDQKKMAIDINLAIENTVTVARNEWKYVADIELNLEPDLPLVPCHPGEFNQAILNLIVNASHAIADVTEKNSQKKGTIAISTDFDEKSAIIKIRDTGSGIPESIQKKIFDPFFTTKEVGKGTGQGLPISRSVIVDKHNGKLYFETQEGKGTVFIIELPLNTEPFCLSETDNNAQA